MQPLNSDSRTVLHAQVDNLPVAVEHLRNPALVDKPLLVRSAGGRDVVVAVSREAAACGTHAGMPTRLALQLCSQAFLVRADGELYLRRAEVVREILAEALPVVERATTAEFYADFTGMERYVGAWRLAGEVKTRVRRHAGLPLSFGLSVNKTVAKVACLEHQPDGAARIPWPQVQPFLDPLPVERLPAVGVATGQTLRAMGVGRVQTLRQVPRRLLEKTFGAMGAILWQRAHGLDDTPVVADDARRTLAADLTFHPDTTDGRDVRTGLVRLTEDLTRQLRGRDCCTGCLTVKLRYADGDTLVRQCTLTPTADDRVLIGYALGLLSKLHQRRVLVRAVGVSFSKLAPGGNQFHCFDDSARLAPLYAAMDRLSARYGPGVVGLAAGWTPPAPTLQSHTGHPA